MEISLGTGRMLAIFFGFVLVCAFFFAIGFSFGRKTAFTAGALIVAPEAAPVSVVRPSAAKNDAHQPTPQSADFSFYKAVSEKNADASLTPPDSKTQPAAAAAAGAPSESPKIPADVATTASGYFVQVAAVRRQEDATALVEALKQKQYPAFTTNSASSDKFYHVQIGPYAEIKDAEAMRARLIGDGYNPIVKK